MTEWNPIETVEPDARVLVFCPRLDPDKQVFEALARPNGEYSDPVYYEWDGTGATHWMPIPSGPTLSKDKIDG